MIKLFFLEDVEKNAIDVSVQNILDNLLTDNQKNTLKIKNLPNLNDDWYLRSNTKIWREVAKIMCYFICKRIPNNNQINNLITCFNKIPKEYKRKLSENNVFGTLLYLWIGFDTKQFGESQGDLNNVNDLIKVFLKLITQKTIQIKIPLCVHREADVVAKNFLADKVKIHSIKKVCHLLKGILDNSNVTKYEITFYLPHSHYKTSTMIFPEIFLNYYHGHLLNEFFLKLDKHYKDTKKVVESYSKKYRTFYVKPMSVHVKQIEKETEKLFGEKWRQVGKWEELTIKSKMGEEIANISREVTESEIFRLIPEYKQGFKKRDKYEINSKIEYNAVQWFFNEGKLNSVTKSIYETMFYYTWGIKSKDNISFGFERDHDLYQVISWKLGYSGKFEYNNFQPLLYARRTKDEVVNSHLKNISFRQFWRLSGK